MTRRRPAALLVALGLLVACGDSNPPGDPDLGAIPAGETCGEVVRPRLQQGSHLIGDAEPPIPYSSNPPTSGWHRAGAPRLGVQQEPLSGPAVVSALEAGQVVIAYDPGAVDEATIARIVELASTTFTDQVTTTAWSPMPSGVALLGWNALQRCNDLDEGTLATFTLTWAGEALRHE